MGLSVIILAAGEGKRMRSSRPKVLHTLAGLSLLEHVCRAAAELQPQAMYCVVGHGGDQVREALPDLPVTWVEQAEQLGTGHAVQQALPHLAAKDTVLILYGDVPLIRAATLSRLVAATNSDHLALMTAHLNDPYGYGRILRDEDGRVTAIVEEKDASAEQRAITEINTGIMACPGAHLEAWLRELDNDNAQGEYYLTDVIGRAADEGMEIVTISPETVEEISGVNNRAQLAVLERAWQRAQAARLMSEGVTLRDPARFDLRGELRAGHDCEIDIDCIFEGRVTLGEGVRVGPYCVVRNARIGDGVEIKAHCVIEDAEIGSESRIGPFARIRPETELADGVHIGNFVEIKKSRVGTHSKINHLSYVGDTTVGRDVNIGAGTITCNYDGANKYRTEIGDGAFIGSDTQLVAPVKVGPGATIGAGSTITRDTPPNELTLSRVPQQTRAGWKRPVKKT